MAVTVEKLENIYTSLLRSVAREVMRIENLEDDMAASDIKLLESSDKILRSALEYYGGKKEPNVLDGVSTDELMGDFE